MEKDLSKFNIGMSVEDAVLSFDCISGVAYQDNDNDNQILVPIFTIAKCYVVDCKVFDKETMTQGEIEPFRTERLGQPIGYFPTEECSRSEPKILDREVAYQLASMGVSLSGFSKDDLESAKSESLKTALLHWHVDDVYMQAENNELEISEEQALMVIERLKNNHDATVGVNWDVISSHIDDVVG
jgi:hypothetical protein